jgi:hypothetical protein
VREERELSDVREDEYKVGFDSRLMEINNEAVKESNVKGTSTEERMKRRVIKGSGK